MPLAISETISAPFSLVPDRVPGCEDSNEEDISHLVEDSDKSMSNYNPL